MTRLPTPGADDGQWGTLLNDFLAVEHNGDGTLKPGGSLAAKADDTAVVHDTGNETIAGIKTFSSSPIVPEPTSSAQAATKSYVDNTLSQIYPISEYGLAAATGDILSFGGGSGIGSGTAFFARIYVPAGVTISALKIAVQSASTYTPNGNANQLGLYDDNGNQLAVTPDDPNLWSTVGWHTGALPSTIPAQSSARFVYAALIVQGYTGVSPLWPNATNAVTEVINGNVNGKRRAMYSGSLTSLPASFNPTSFGISTSYVPLIGLVP